MPVKKRYDSQITTPINSDLKAELLQIKDELGLSDLTDLVRRVLQDFANAYYKRESNRAHSVPAVARQAVLGGGARTTASFRNVESVIRKLTGALEVPDQSTSLPEDMKPMEGNSEREPE